MSYALKKGTTSKILLVYALDAADMRSGKTGLSSQTPDSSAAYIREGESQVRRIALVEGKLGEHRAGSFVEIDSKLLPGVYQFGVPDEMLAAGAETVTLMLKFPGASLSRFPFISLLMIRRMLTALECRRSDRKGDALPSVAPSRG